MKKSATLASLFFSLSLSAFADDFAAQVVSVSGKVLHRNEENKAIKMGFLKPGEKIFKGSVVNTGSDGSLKLLMTDRTIIDLGPSSLFKINEYKLNQVSDRTVELSLDQGKMRTSVNKKLTDEKGKFTVRTKTATMGVRGTEFIISAPLIANNTSGKADLGSIVVTSGQVSTTTAQTSSTGVGSSLGSGFSPGSSVSTMVKAGQAMGFGDASGGSSAPKTLDAQKMSEVKTEATVPDKTFAQNITFDSKSAPSNQPSTSSQNKSGEGEKKNDSKADAKTDGKSDSKTDAKNGSSGGTSNSGPGPNQVATQISNSIAQDIKFAMTAPPMVAPPNQNFKLPPEQTKIPADTQRAATGNANVHVIFNPN